MNRKDQRSFFIPLSVITALAFIAAVYFLPIAPFSEEKLNLLFKDVLTRAAIIAVLVIVLIRYSFDGVFFSKKRYPSPILLVAAFCVAIVNFPFPSFFSGKASIVNPAALPLLFIDCVAVAVEEELFFRGVLYSVITDFSKGKKRSLLLRIILSAFIFGVFHLFNGFSGEVFLQTLYTFFLGCLLAVLKEAFGNIFIGAIVHLLFNFGGSILQYAGEGEYFSLPFVLITVTVACFAGVVCIIILQKMSERSERDEELDGEY